MTATLPATGAPASVAGPPQRSPLEATSLYRFFRAGDQETLALRGVSIRVDRGEVVAVTGPSGSGKSTLLACLAGLDEPSGGTVRIDGQRISGRPETVRARLRSQHVGVLLQYGNLLEHLTVAGNARLAQALVPRDRREDLRALFAALGITDRASAYPSRLSGGEAARAGLAVALANDPDVLLADEPSGELDGDTERELLSLFVERARSGTAVVVASHSPAVARIADRVLVLSDGQLA